MTDYKKYLTCKTVVWRTPRELFRKLDEEFNFTLDPCSTHDNALCEKHYTEAEDGLAQDWQGERVFCNPPYGKALSIWERKCWEESRKKDTLVVMLVPSRTDTAWFHEYVLPYSEIRYCRGRLHFNDSRENIAPFASMIIIFKPQQQ